MESKFDIQILENRPLRRISKTFFSPKSFPMKIAAELSKEIKLPIK